MNVLDTSDCEDPVGLDYLVEYLQIHKEGMRMSGKKRARGILLVGPPGTGKTMLAKAIGRLVDLPVVEFRISALMNSLLGETETRFAQAFATLEAMAPNVVFRAGWWNDDALYRIIVVLVVGQSLSKLYCSDM